MESPNWRRVAGTILTVGLILSVVLNGRPTSLGGFLLLVGGVSIAVGLAFPGIPEHVQYYRWGSLGAAGVGGLLTLAERSAGPVDAGIYLLGGAVVTVIGVTLLNRLERAQEPN